MEFKGLERVAKAPRKADGTQSKYDGEYILTFIDGIFDNSTGESVQYEVNVTASNGVLTIDSEEFNPIKAQIDEETGVVTFVNTYLGASSSYAFSYIPVDFKNQATFVSFTATFNEDATELVFPSATGILEGGWGWTSAWQKTAAVKAAQSFDLNSTYFGGWFFGYLFDSMKKGGFTYASAGKVTYYDGLMTVNSAINEIYSWDIEIEECNEVEGLYRMQPYAVENPVGTALGLGVDTETYVYVNISNPEKVFTKGQFSPYGVETFSGVNAENNFNADYYGTYQDGIIEFPEPSFAFLDTAENGWYIVSNEGQPSLRIVFEGAAVKDYTIEAYTDSPASANNTWTVSVAKGADVASVKYVVLPYDFDYSIAVNAGITIEKYGAVVTGDSFTVSPATSNVLNKPMTESDFAIVYVGAFNEAGVMKGYTQLSLAVIFDAEQDGWTTVGTTTFTDPYFSGFLGGNFTFDNVEVQAKADNSAVYRLINPYVGLTQYVDGIEYVAGDKTVAMVIDATDPTWVALPQCMTGIADPDYGYAAVGNIAALGYDKETMPAGIGVVTLEDNVVKLASQSPFIRFNYECEPGNWWRLKSTGEITLPAITVDVIVKGQDGTALEGVKVALASAAEEGIDTQSDENDIVTDAEGKATIDVPFTTGYFGKVNIDVEGKTTEVTLNGAKNEVEVTIDTTGIKEVSSVSADKVVYDIQGRRVANPTRGLYIVNGKKAFVK